MSDDSHAKNLVTRAVSVTPSSGNVFTDLGFPEGEAKLLLESADIKAQLAEAESRALQAVAREAGHAKALEEISKEIVCHGPTCFECDTDSPHPLSRAAAIALEAIRLTSPRAKQLLAIVAAARALINGRGGEFLLEQDLEVGRYADPDARELEAALTTQPVDEENSR